jgi:hypothetical protein
MKNVTDLSMFSKYGVFSFVIESETLTEEEATIQSWRVTDFSEYELIIKLEFYEPLLISAA